MKRLSRYEEILIIRAAQKESKFLSNGSSRAVYDIGNGRVLKVAIDRKGQYQNKTEIELYRNSNSREYLAAIYAYGKYCIVMEKVIVTEYSDMSDLIDGSRYFNDDSTDSYLTVAEGLQKFYETPKLKVETFREAYNYLCYENGRTSDNYQIGIRADGSAAAYDYGFVKGAYHMCVSDHLYNNLENGDFSPLKLVEAMLVRKSNKLTFSRI